MTTAPEIDTDPASNALMDTILATAAFNAKMRGLSGDQVLHALINAAACFMAHAACEEHWPAIRANLLESIPAIIDGHRRLAMIGETKGNA